MTELVVPTEKFFLRFGKIEIFGVGGGNGFGEVCNKSKANPIPLLISSS
jgi:hypothetical protein